MIGKFVVIDTLNNFKSKLSSIPSSAIVLIKDVGQIYAHGTYFGAQKTYELLNLEAAGLAPAGGINANGLISNVESEWVLTVTNGKNPVWKKLPANAFSNDSFELKAATTSDLGGIKVGSVYNGLFSTLTGKHYAVNVDNAGLAYVSVPWDFTDLNVKQTSTSLLNEDFSLLFSHTADDSTHTEGTRKASNLKFNPSTGTLTTTILKGNLDGSYINKLTGYSKASTKGSISTNDSLNTALGKLEHKADVAYDLVDASKPDSTTIDTLREVLNVLSGITDTLTIQGILGNYVTLAGTETITGKKTFTLGITVGSEGGTSLVLSSTKGYTNLCFNSVVNSLNNSGYLSYKGDMNYYVSNSGWTKEGKILHSENTYIKDGSVSINGASITPVDVTSDLKITGLKTFSKPVIIEHTLKITSLQGPKYILMGNLDSGGVNNPFVITSANGRLVFHNGDSWLDNGGTLTSIIEFSKDVITSSTSIKATKFVTTNGTSSQFVKGDGSLDSTSYLPTTGGTLKGSLYFEAGENGIISVGNSTTLPGHIYRGIHETGGNVYDHYYNGKVTADYTYANLRVKSLSGFKVLRFGGDGSFTWNTYKVWHSGNDGHDSGLDADTLDSLHASNFFKLSDGTIISNNSDLNTYTAVGTYSCITDASSQTLYNCPILNAFRLVVSRPLNGSDHILQELTAYWGSTKYARVYYPGSKTWLNWTLLATNLDIYNAPTATTAKYLDYSSTSMLDDPASGMIGYAIVHAGTANVGDLPVASNANGILTIKSHPNTNYHHQLAFTDNGFFYRNMCYKALDTTSKWKLIAFTDSNVESANKLSKTIKLWGLNFDGSADVYGPLYSYGSGFIYPSETFTSFGNTSKKTYIDGEAIWFNASGATNMVIDTSGNVGINNASPSEKLDVTGNVKASKFITSGGTSIQCVMGDGSVTEKPYYSIVNHVITDLNAYTRYDSGLTMDLFSRDASNKPSAGNNANGVLTADFGKHGSANPYGFQLACMTYNEKLYFRSFSAGAFTDWKTVAFIDSTVQAANKLANTVYLWGQAFDGTLNVVGNIRMGTNGGGIGYKADTKTWTYFPVYLHNNADDTVFFRMGLTGGNNTFSYFWAGPTLSTFVIDKVSNVGIGTTTPSHKLHVEGDGYFNGSVRLTTVRDANGNWILGKESGDEGLISVGSNNLTQPVFIGNSKGKVYLNSTGNVTVGNSDKAGSDYKLCVDGLTYTKALTSEGNILPKANNTYYLGNSNYKWNITSGRISVEETYTEHNSPTALPLCITVNKTSEQAMTAKHAPGIGFHIGSSSWSSLIYYSGLFQFVNGDFSGNARVKASGFVKENSTDEYILLGGGGHKAVSTFAMAVDYLPLAGGVMTGDITWNSDSHGIYLYGGCGIEKWSGLGPALVAEGDNVDFWIRNGKDRSKRFKIWHSGSFSPSNYLPLTGGSLSGTLSIYVNDSDNIFTLKSNSGVIKLINTASGNYIESGNKDFTGNVALNITGYNGNKGSNLYLHFTNTSISGSVSVTGAINPAASLTHNLGSSSLRWNCLNAGYANLTSTLDWLLTLKNTATAGNAHIAYVNAKGNTWTAGINSINNFLFIYNNETNKAIGFNTEGLITCNGFNKRDSSDSYVLLGGGGHMLISDIVVDTTTLEFEKELTVGTDWVDTGIQWTSEYERGSYVIQVSFADYYYFTGLMTINPGGPSHERADEIILHGGGFDWSLNSALYLRTYNDATNRVYKLQIARHTTTSKRVYKFKLKKLI